jgi:hypothetical protein
MIRVPPMQDNTEDNTVPFPTADKNPLPDIPNGKVLQILIAARERFFPQVTPEEAEKVSEMLKANPDLSMEQAGKMVVDALDLDNRRAAWQKKESNIEPMIDEVAAIVKKYGLFPMASPRAVAAYMFHQVQGLGLVFHDMIEDAKKHGGETDEDDTE